MRRNVSESIAVMLETDSVSLRRARRCAHPPRGAARRTGGAARDRRDRAGPARRDRRGRGEPSSLGGVPRRRHALPPRDRERRAQRAAARLHELDARRAAAVADRYDRRLDRRRGDPATAPRDPARDPAAPAALPPSAPCAATSTISASSSRPSPRGRHRESGTHARLPPAARVRRAAEARARASDRRLIRIGGAGVCATDLHAIEGLMEPAGVTLPRVLGHENAGWVEEVGAGVTTVAKGDAVLVFPPHSCGLCVPCRRGIDMLCIHHQFTGLTVDGGFADYVLVPERSLAAPARRRRAGRGRAARRRRPHRLPRGATARASRHAGHDRRRDRRRRRRPHRAAAAPRARSGRNDRDRHRLAGAAALATELGADDVLDGSGVGRRGARADGRPRRRPRVRLRRHRPVARRRDGDARPRRHLLDRRLRRHGHGALGWRSSATSTPWRATSSEPGSTCGRSCSSTRRAGSCSRPRRTRWTSVNEVLAKLRDGEITGRAVLVPG